MEDSSKNRIILNRRKLFDETAFFNAKLCIQDSKLDPGKPKICAMERQQKHRPNILDLN